MGKGGQGIRVIEQEKLEISKQTFLSRAVQKIEATAGPMSHGGNQVMKLVIEPQAFLIIEIETWRKMVTLIALSLMEITL